MSQPVNPVFVPAEGPAAAYSTLNNNNKKSLQNAMQRLQLGEYVPYAAPITPQQVQLERITIRQHEQEQQEQQYPDSSSEETASEETMESTVTTAAAAATTTTDSTDDDDCPICLEALDPSSSLDFLQHPSHSSDNKVVVGLPKCPHKFHQACLQESWKHQNSAKCPVCRTPAVERTFGKSPSGCMQVSILQRHSCPGFHDTLQTLQLQYEIPSGRQMPYHDHPGHVYHGTTRTAYLPYNQAGLRLLQRLVYAFEHGYTFQIGTSLTTGRSNCVTWSSIHHKTSLHGGAHGFPDDAYLDNCHGSLDALHVPKATAAAAAGTTTTTAGYNPAFPLQVHYHAPTSMPSMEDAMIILSPPPRPPNKRLKQQPFKNGIYGSDHPDGASAMMQDPNELQSSSRSCCSKCHGAITANTTALCITTCQHILHESCWTPPSWNCPICHASIVSPNQTSPSGILQMRILPHPTTCPGFDSQVMECRYDIPSHQIQQPYHPNPGLSIPSTTRNTYLPFNQQGCDLYIRLRYAWSNGYIFKIGTSWTTGKSNVVVWNAAIPHKTSLQGGIFGFPDASYLTACHGALDALKIPDSWTCWTQWEHEKSGNTTTTSSSSSMWLHH